ncbi:CopG family transcriptional regulator [Streptomyces sp. NPDC051940]|uniref:ribbon-helix-helix domain-containing protein n=1 Tax=Streptomyces sp. NPDC051940 TaxID=3155675 RepID=UPI00341C168F
MRTTVDLSEDLLQEAKLRAARRRVTLSAVIEDAVRASFARDLDAARNIAVRLPVYGSGGLQPGVDLSDNAGLLDMMDEAELRARYGQ